ncbi:Ribonuclease/ribotoxin [Massarina eburnea CBS 473.64]|uniref:ribonuclease T1 n=1 Tax=Massarina eburnea CBS 473.64 TaxID=1395130 RepID=A0A6A6RPQ5_9PLEO|nr:Ribonuclease/ribotoxin [Massarina eburnea CBS 473.64]
MIAIKLITFSILLTSITALPTTDLESRIAHDGDWTCKNTAGDLQFTAAHIQATLKKAPITPGSSGYPHKFNNGYDETSHARIKGYTSIDFRAKPCNKAPTDKTYLMEFPIESAGKFYDAGKKPKADPGPARVIFHYPSKTLCGLVGHESGNTGPLNFCEAR